MVPLYPHASKGDAECSKTVNNSGIGNHRFEIYISNLCWEPTQLATKMGELTAPQHDVILNFVK